METAGNTGSRPNNLDSWSPSDPSSRDESPPEPAAPPAPPASADDIAPVPADKRQAVSLAFATRR